MKHKVTLNALKRLHAELGGKIKENRKDAKHLTALIKNVEAVLKMLDPSLNVRGIKARRRYKRNEWFKHGQISRHAIDVLRKAGKPMTSRQIADALFEQRGIEKPSGVLARNLFGAVHVALRNRQGKTVEAAGEGLPVKWQLIG